MNLETFIAELDARGLHPKKTATGYTCRCPAHEDRNPSLAISDGSDGRILLHCHANCTPEAIVSSIGLQMSDLFTEKLNGHHLPVPARQFTPRLVKTYDYTDETGTLLFQTCRYEPKTFKQRRPTADGSWSWSLGDTRKPLYHLPSVLEAVVSGQPIFIVEGEKDAEAIIQAGGIATCNPMGAGKWKPEHTDSLNGAARLIIIADKDATGRKHAAQVEEACRTVCTDVSVVEVPGDSKDAAEYLAKGGSLPELLAAKADPRLPKLRDLAALLAEPDNIDVAISEATMALASLRPPTSDDWPKPITVLEWNQPENRPEPRPELVTGLLRRGDKLILGGGAKSCKTWFAMALSMAIGSGTEFLGFPTHQTETLFINLELQEDVMWQRTSRLLHDLKLHPSICKMTVWNLRAARNLSVEELERRLTDSGLKPGLIVIDPLYKLLGDRSENDAAEMTSLFQILEGIAHRLKAAILIPAHFSKGNQSEKSAIDRISGSGAIARDADALITMTAHEEEGAFTLDFTLRAYAPLNSFAVRWEYPLFSRDDALDPDKLKLKVGRPKFEVDKLLDLFPAHGLTIPELKDLALSRFQIKRTSCYNHFTELLGKGRIKLKMGSNPATYVVNHNLP